MCLMNTIKISNRHFMMDMNNFIFFTFLANPLCSRNRFKSCSFPANTIRTWGTTPPTGMAFTSIKFRLPFSHAVIIAKNFFRMEVRLWSGNFFSAPFTNFSNKIGATRILSSVFTFLSAIPGTKCLVPFSGAYIWFPTNWAKGRRLFLTPSILKITLIRTKVLIWSSIIGMKFIPTKFTNFSFVNFFHTYIINTIARLSSEIEEKYCEIAVKDLLKKFYHFRGTQWHTSTQ